MVGPPMVDDVLGVVATVRLPARPCPGHVWSQPPRLDLAASAGHMRSHTHTPYTAFTGHAWPPVLCVCLNRWRTLFPLRSAPTSAVAASSSTTRRETGCPKIQARRAMASSAWPPLKRKCVASNFSMPRRSKRVRLLALPTAPRLAISGHSRRLAMCGHIWRWPLAAWPCVVTAPLGISTPLCVCVLSGRLRAHDLQAIWDEKDRKAAFKKVEKWAVKNVPKDPWHAFEQVLCLHAACVATCHKRPHSHGNAPLAFTAPLLRVATCGYVHRCLPSAASAGHAWPDRTSCHPPL